MMKKILFTLTILLLATGSLTAQEINNPELKKFVQELRAPGNGPRNVSKNKEKGIYAINSVDEKSYKALSAIIEKYDIYFAEEIFGMELMFSTRESGNQTIIFQGDTYGLAITDNAHSLDLVVIIVKGSAAKLFFGIRETGDVEIHSHEVYFNNRDGDVYIGESCITAERPAELIDISEAESIERRIPAYIGLELFDYYMPMIQELKEKAQSATSKEQLKMLKTSADSIRDVWEAEIQCLENLMEKVESPGRAKIPCTGKMMIVIPKDTKQGLYEWINSTGICRTEGQETTIIPATDIAAFVATKTMKLQTSWSLEGYSKEMKAVFAEEVPGGEPAYIYRRSTTAEGYRTMKKDLEQFFYLDGKNPGHKYKGFRAIERIDTDEYCFLHLYGDNTTILIFDCPGKEHCQMDIIVGGIELFNEAVNDISIDHEKGHATKCNIIIRGGEVEFADGEVEINGVTYDNGVHFTTEYMEKLK